MDDEIEKIGEIRLVPSKDDIKNFLKKINHVLDKYKKEEN